ncbi:MAG TPA: cysteine hydrolase [Mycobacteriales bacterium]|nr:cysteine hydrolase [Mycobacteriales bacterium]
MSVTEIQATPERVQVDLARTAMIVVDMQHAFGSEGGMFDKAGVPIESIQAAVAPTVTAVEAARRAGMRIVYLKMGFLPDLSDLGAEDVPNGVLFLHLGVKDGVLERDTWGTDILEELTPAPEDTVLYKTRFSGFYKTELDELLKSWGVKHLVVTGCTTSICVESTVRDAFFRDYHCIVLEDCTAEPMGLGLSRSNHEATTMLFERIFASVSSSASFVQALEPEMAPTS